MSFMSSIHALVKSNIGLLLIAAAQGFFSSMNVSVKLLHSMHTSMSALELVFIRMFITLFCCLLYMYLKKVEDPFLGPKGVRLLLCARGFSGFVSLFGMYYSLQYLSLSDATVITFLAPICTGISSALFLGEPFRLKEALAGLVSLSGVTLIARPTFIFGHASDMTLVTPSQRLIAIGFSLLGALGATGAYTTLRAIGKRAHPMHSISLFSSQCVIASSIGMGVTQEPFVIPKHVEWISLLFVIGISGFLAQILLTMGLAREKAGRGATAIYMQIVFAILFERLVFKTTPSLLSLLGTIIILGSAFFVTLTKEKEDGENDEQSKEAHQQIRLERLGDEEQGQGLLKDASEVEE